MKTEPGEPPVLLISGEWEIDSLSLQANFPGDYRMSLLLVNGGTSFEFVWGHYDFVAMEGMLRAESRSSENGSQQFVFKHAGRDTGTGEISFGQLQTGEMTVYKDGSLDGCFFDLFEAEHELQGRRLPGPRGVCGRDRASFEGEWAIYNEDQYEQVRIGRWG